MTDQRTDPIPSGTHEADLTPDGVRERVGGLMAQVDLGRKALDGIYSAVSYDQLHTEPVAREITTAATKLGSAEEQLLAGASEIIAGIGSIYTNDGQIDTYRAVHASRLYGELIRGLGQYGPGRDIDEGKVRAGLDKLGPGAPMLAFTGYTLGISRNFELIATASDKPAVFVPKLDVTSDRVELRGGTLVFTKSGEDTPSELDLTHLGAVGLDEIKEYILTANRTSVRSLVGLTESWRRISDEEPTFLEDKILKAFQSDLKEAAIESATLSLGDTEMVGSDLRFGLAAIDTMPNGAEIRDRIEDLLAGIAHTSNLGIAHSWIIQYASAHSRLSTDGKKPGAVFLGTLRRLKNLADEQSCQKLQTN